MSTDHTGGMSPFDSGSLSSGLGLPLVASASPSAQESVLGAWTNTAAVASALGPEYPEISVANGAIEFRVIRAGSPVRRLRLTGNRYTFGSAEGCSIRLSDPSLRPMHAVLIRDTRRILLRAYTVPIEVNERRTTEANLEIGDVVRMGAYRFELLPFEESRRPFESAVNPATDDDDPTAWRERLRREIDQWRARQTECAQREVRCDDRETVLRSRETELWSRAEQLHRRESHLMSQESAAIQIQEEYAKQNGEVSRLQEEHRAQQETLEQKDSELRRLEIEYREEIEQAARQIKQSREQTESANESVQRMRDQFAALNQQLEDLRKQQDEIEQHDLEHVQEHKELLAELQSAREEVDRVQTASDASRTSALARVEELDAQLQQAQAESEVERRRADESEEAANQLRQQIQEHKEQLTELQSAREELTRVQAASDESRTSALARVDELDAQLRQAQAESESQRCRADESEKSASQLRQQIEELEKCVSDASHEAARLRQDYEQACESIRSLESIIDQGNVRGEQDRDSWFAEAEQLRQSVEHLSVDLAKANGELDDLRNSNASLKRQLDDMAGQRDAASSELEMRPTTEAIESLRQELELANQKLTRMQSDYEETLTQLAAAIEENQTQRDQANAPSIQEPGNFGLEQDSSIDSPSPQLIGGATAASMLELIDEIASTSDDQSIDDSAAAESSESSKVNDQQDGWPTHQSATPVTESSIDSSGNESSLPSDNSSDDSEPPSEWMNDQSDRANANDRVDEYDRWNQTETNETESVEDEEVDPSSGSAFGPTSDQAEAPQWLPDSREPQASSPHVAAWDTPEDAADDPEDASYDSASSDQLPACDAEFDRALDSDASETADPSPEQSVDDAITDIERGVDEAISGASGFVEPMTDDAEILNHAVETSDIDTDSEIDDRSDAVASDWDLPAADQAQIVDEPHSGSQDLSEQGSFVDSDHDAEDDVFTSNDESSQQQEDDGREQSPWGYETLEKQAEDWGETESGQESVDHDAEVSPGAEIESPATWDSQPQWDSGEPEGNFSGSEELLNDDPDSEESNIPPDSPWPNASEDESPDAGIDGGLAGELIRDLNSDTQSQDIEPEEDGTYLWERPDAIPGEVPNDQQVTDNSMPNHEQTTPFSWDQEYPEESRSSEWTNDPEGERSEVIQSSGAESAFDAQEFDADGPPVSEEHSAEPDQTPVSNAAEASGPTEENDDSIEAYMNRLLQRVQGEPLADSVGQSTPVVSPPPSNSESSPEPADSTTETAQTLEPLTSDAPLVPRSQAPERNSNLSAMRELANHSARTAVARSVRIQSRDIQLKGLVKFAQAGVAILCAAACYMFLDWAPMLKSIVIGAILVIAAIVVQEGVVLLKDAKHRLSAAENGVSHEPNHESTESDANDPTNDYPPSEPVAAELAETK